jgi:hypothetical protein
MTCSETKRIVSILLLDVQYPVFQYGDKIMLAIANFKETIFSIQLYDLFLCTVSTSTDFGYVKFVRHDFK